MAKRAVKNNGDRKTVQTQKMLKRIPFQHAASALQDSAVKSFQIYNALMEDRQFLWNG